MKKNDLNFKSKTRNIIVCIIIMYCNITKIKKMKHAFHKNT